jgi:hypothetical protein
MEVLGVCMVASRQEHHIHASGRLLQNDIANQNPLHTKTLNHKAELQCCMGTHASHCEEAVGSEVR